MNIQGIEDWAQEYFPDAQQSSKGFKAKCPAHEDKNPSLSIGLRGDGKGVLLCCHAGCSTEEICTALNITKRKLFFGNGDSGVKDLSRSPKTRVTKPKPTAKRKTEKRNEQHTATFIFYDAEGKIVARKHRYDYENVYLDTGEVEQDKRFVIEPTGSKLPLYNLPAVLSAVRQGWEIWLVEGEVKADRLNDWIREEWGYDVVATSYGGHWKPEFATLLKGASRIVLFSDRDEAGRRIADNVIRDLHEAGITNIAKADITSLFPNGGQ